MVAAAWCLLAALMAAALEDAAADLEAGAARAARWMGRPEVQWRPPQRPARAAGAVTGPHDALPVIEASVQSEDEATRLRGLEGLARSGAAEHVAAFVSALSDPSRDVRDLAARVLATLDPALTFSTVMDVLVGGGPEWAGVQAALPALRDSLEKPMLNVLTSKGETRPRKLAAAWSLGQMRSAPAAPLLADLAWASDAELAVCCARALVALRDSVAVPLAAPLTAHPVIEVRWTIVEGLAGLSDPEAMAALGGVAAEPPLGDRDLSRRAAALLGATGDEHVIPLLIEAMRRNPWVRGTAGEALRRMTGQALGNLPSDWAAWFEQPGPAPGPGPPGPPEPFAEIMIMPE